MSHLPSSTKQVEPARALHNRARAVMEIFQHHNPNPKCELNHTNPFELLVAVVLSAQTTDNAVNKCTTKLFKVCSTPQQLYALGQPKLLSYIASLGLAPTKAKHLIQLAKQLIDHHNSQVPCAYADLIALPGVGRKTAHVIQAEVFGQPTLAVDTHVLRVGRRLGFHTAQTPLGAEQQLLKVIAKSYLPKAHHWLILHGRYQCKARQPTCTTCIVAHLCPKLTVKSNKC